MLMMQIEDDQLPMTLVNIHTGQTLKKLKISSLKSEVEFLEQFNNKVFIKLKSKPLKILDILSQEKTEVPEFVSPEAFIFLYDKDKFLTLRDGRIEIWSS